MKRLLKATLPFLAFTGSMLIAQEDPDAKQPPAKGQTEQNARRATVGKIVKSSDGQYMLMDTRATVYQLDPQTAAKQFAGKMVKVSGAVDANNTIHVTDITPAVEQAR